MSDQLAFFCNWITDPRRVAAAVPSGKELAELITREIKPEHAPIIELGAGTGVFTQQLITRGIPQDELALIEYGSEFMRILQWRFPTARVLWMDAATLGTIDLFEGRQAGAVVSGLPLLSMPPRKVVRILLGAFRHLRPGGAFYQFTYGPRCPVPRVILERFGLKASRLGTALANFPPATVYRILRRNASTRPFRSVAPPRIIPPPVAAPASRG